MGFFILIAFIAFIAIRHAIKADQEKDARARQQREEAEARRIMQARGMTVPNITLGNGANSTHAAAPTQRECVRVAGTSFRTEALMRFAEGNDGFTASKRERVDENYYDDKEYQFIFSPKTAELIPEPENPHDPNAIRVDFDGLTVGYIPKVDTRRIRGYIEDGRIQSLEPYIGGGAYKELVLSDDIGILDEPKLSDYTLVTDEVEYFARIYITLRTEKD